MSDIQIPLFYVPRKSSAQAHPSIATTPELEAILREDPVIAYNCSSGKDGFAAALIADRYLNTIGHAGPRLVIHADLGRVEWKDSQALCQEQADYLGHPLVTVRRAAGGLMERWQQRWQDNLVRYRDLACVTLILPWSTAKWRYCTSELKSAIIASELKRRFPNRTVINVTGIRRQESRARSRKPVFQIEKRLSTNKVSGYIWHPGIDYPVEDVWTTIRASGVRIHPAYEIYKSTRVSCVLCILASEHDHRAALLCPENHAIYIEMVELEATSTFAFQSHRWLADLAPSLLGADLRARIATAKKLAAERQKLEAQIPKHLLFVDELPTRMPSKDEASLLARVRRDMGQLLGIDVHYTTGDAVEARFAQLLRDGKKALKLGAPRADTSDIATTTALLAGAGGGRPPSRCGEQLILEV